MEIPKLKRSSRSREFNFWSSEIKDEIVYRYLFGEISHRNLESEVIGLEGKQKVGYQSMGILHYLGIVGSFKGIFKDMSIEDAITSMEEDIQDFSLIISMLRRHKAGKSELGTLEQYNKDLAQKIFDSRKVDSIKRKSRLKKSSSKASEKLVTTIVYDRNPDVVAEVLERANGNCEKCMQPAPFLRASDGTPYLECHHKVPLSKGGEDTVENAIGVCPNCHRELHFGM